MASFVDKVARIPCGNCNASVDTAAAQPLSQIDCPSCGSALTVPGAVGKLLLKKVIGKGAAGIVYQAYDQENQRNVALKVFLKENTLEGDGRDAGRDPGSMLWYIDTRRRLHWPVLGPTEVDPVPVEIFQGGHPDLFDPLGGRYVAVDTGHHESSWETTANREGLTVHADGEQCIAAVAKDLGGKARGPVVD